MKLTRLFMALILSSCAIFTAFIGVNQINSEKSVVDKSEYKGIISVWQVDGFEGGIGSRKQFLLKSARSFEKKNNGLLVMVTDRTPEGVKEDFKKGVYPDLISYSVGTEVIGISELNVERKVSGGKIGGKDYATAWCRGGYLLITNPKLVTNVSKIDKLLVSQAEYTLPLIALLESGIQVDNVEVLPPFDAYLKFVSGKTPYFLATQRDIIRLNNRGMEVNATPLDGFSDLYQYISITATDQQKRYYANEFINHLTSDDVQKDLDKIGLMSAFYPSAHENQVLSLMQSTKIKSTVSAFLSPVQIKELQSLSQKAVMGDEDALNKIKNVLV